MAVWMCDKTGKQFDDGLMASPGEPEFTRDLAKAHYGSDEFSYVGTPAKAVPAEAEEADGQPIVS